MERLTVCTTCRLSNSRTEHCTLPSVASDPLRASEFLPSLMQTCPLLTSHDLPILLVIDSHGAHPLMSCPHGYFLEDIWLMHFKADGFQRQTHTNKLKGSFCFSLDKQPGPAMQIVE